MLPRLMIRAATKEGKYSQLHQSFAKQHKVSYYDKQKKPQQPIAREYMNIL